MQRKSFIMDVFLDIDGDVCYYVYSVVEVFCKLFKNFIEQLYIDFFNDFKWLVDLRELFQEICLICNVKYIMLYRYVSYRWFFVYDVILDVLRFLYCFIFYGFLSYYWKGLSFYSRDNLLI